MLQGIETPSCRADLAQERWPQQNSRDHFADDLRLADHCRGLAQRPADQNNQNNLREQNGKRPSRVVVKGFRNAAAFRHRARHVCDGIMPLQAAACDQSQPDCRSASRQNQNVGKDVPHGPPIVRDHD